MRRFMGILPFDHQPPVLERREVVAVEVVTIIARRGGMVKREFSPLPILATFSSEIDALCLMEEPLGEGPER
jgi:hypothetical protein